MDLKPLCMGICKDRVKFSEKPFNICCVRCGSFILCEKACTKTDCGYKVYEEINETNT